jgi:ribosomal protein L3 glutamine methyltransferase
MKDTMNLDNQNLAQLTQELTTIRDYIRFAFSRFNASNLYYGHGTDNAWDEAMQLVLSALELPPDCERDLLKAKLTMVERRELCEYIFRRIDGVPIAYLTKKAWFAGLPFYVDKRVIIPRSPFAELIETGFAPWLNNQETRKILDLCTGSGCMAIACALTFEDSQVDAVDISKDALEVAKINVNKHHVTESVHLIESDLFENVVARYDLIICNPPYVSEEEYTSLPKEYQHEPALALKAKEHGIDIIKRVLKEAGNYLKPDGCLFLEVGNCQQLLTETFPETPFLWLEFARGGEGILLLTKEQLDHHQQRFEV